MEEKTTHEIGDYVYIRFEIEDVRTIKDTKRKYMVLRNRDFGATLYAPLSDIEFNILKCTERDKTMKENIERLFQTSKEHPYCTVTYSSQNTIQRFLKCVQVDYLAEIEMYRIICEKFDEDVGNYLAKYFVERNLAVLEIIPDISIP